MVKSVQVQLTNKCEQRCIMCKKYTWASNWIDLNILLSKLRKYASATFTFSGGDPLSYLYLENLTNYLNVLRIDYQVLTNLDYNLDINYRRYFLESAEFIQVSLDGFDSKSYNSIRRPLKDSSDIEYGFDRVVRNLKLLKSMGKNVKLNSTISIENIGWIEKIAQVAYDIGYPIRFFKVHTDKSLMLEDGFNIEESVLPFMDPKVLANTNLMMWLDEDKTPTKCYIKKYHRIIDEKGYEYTCCRAINDNGLNWDGKYAIELNNYISETLDDVKVMYEYCEACDGRYKKKNNPNIANEEKIYL